MKGGSNAMSSLMMPVLALKEILAQNEKKVSMALKILGLLAFLVYFLCAQIHDSQGSMPLAIFTLVIGFFVLYESFNQKVYEKINQMDFDISQAFVAKIKKVLKVVACLLIIAFFGWLFVDILLTDPQQLQSLLGVMSILFVCVVFSKHPNDISWRPVLWGLLLQFVFGLLVLRTDTGFSVIKSVGDQFCGDCCFNLCSDCWCSGLIPE